MKYLSLFLAVLAFIGVYGIYFYILGYPESKTDVWGQFGDFVGGILNPILSFTSIYLLIKTLSLQDKATQISQRETELSKAEAVEARKTINLQTKLAATQNFETSLFNLIRLAIEEYSTFELVVNSKIFKGNKAYTHIEKVFSHNKNKGHPAHQVLQKIDDYYGDACYSLVKSFSSIFKFINENAPEESQHKYVSIVSSLMPTQAIYILCIAKNHSGWGMLNHINNSGFFEKPGITSLVSGYL